MSLDELRIEIDKIDKQLKELFIKRLKIADQVALYKAKTGDKILKPEREHQVIKHFIEDLDQDDRLEFTSLIRKVMEVSRTRQYRKVLKSGTNFQIPFLEEESVVHKVCYQGLPGSYSEIAAVNMFKNVENYPVKSFEDVFTEIKNGNADVGILPLENTTAGTINEVYDLLIKYNLSINFSYVIKVDHCIAGVKGSSLETIKEVSSHAQAISQSQEFLKIQGIKANECSNTAVAAKLVAEQQDLSIGAICSVEAANRYGLDVIAEGINHNKENATKFIGISRNLSAKRNHNRISIVFACPHVSGSLASVLGIFGDYGINLTEIHSRPDGKNSWEYLFYVDFAGNFFEEGIKALFYQLNEELPYIKILGSYESSL